MNNRAISTAPCGLVAARWSLVAIVVVTAGFYFTWRLGVLNVHHLLWARAFLAAEIVGFLCSVAFLASTVTLARREPPPPLDASVDVFVPSYNEPFDVVRRTLTAATAIEHPHATWLLDDGNRSEMRRLATTLGCRYLSREETADGKAGNLNAALRHATGEFIALFDADHVADPRFLHRTLGYFADERVGFVQTPQEFFNFDAPQYLAGALGDGTVHEQSLFFRVIQRARDAANAAMFCGSSAVVRRAALDAIGGFATGTVTEDLHTSVRLHAAGWRSIFHPETLSAGIAPFESRGFRLQRLRWAQGAFQVFAQEKLLLRTGLTLRQRFYYLLHVLNHVEGWRHACFFLSPTITLAGAFSPLSTNAGAYLLHFLPYFVASVLAFEELGRGHGRFLESELYNLARCVTSIHATFALGNRKLAFRVTPKTRQRGADVIGMMLPWLVLLGTLGASALALYRVVMGVSPFPEDSLAIVLAWAGFTAWIAVRLIALAHRCARNRRTATRLPCAIPAMLSAQADGPAAWAEILAATPDGVTLRTNLGSAPPIARMHRLELALAGRPFTVAVALEPRGDGRYGGALRWRCEADRAAFDVALHQRYIRRLASLERGDCSGLAVTLGPRLRLARAAAFCALLAALLVAATTSDARADDTLLLAGTDVSSVSTYTSVGAIVSLDDDLQKTGPLLRLWGDRLTYDFNSDGERVGVLCWGESASFGYQWREPGGLVSAYAGVDDETTALAPAVSSPTAGTHIGSRFELDVDRNAAPNMTVGLIGSLVTATHDYWTRVQVLERVGMVQLGPEAVWQGNPDYHGSRVGLAAGDVGLGRSVRLSLSGGLQTLNGNSSAYSDLSLSTAL